MKWLEDEDYILKSPMKRINKIKTKTVVNEDCVIFLICGLFLVSIV